MTWIRGGIPLLLLFLTLPCPAGDLLQQAAELIRQNQADRALALFSTAAEAGDATGLYGLGVLYFEGTGVAADIERSSRYFQGAAERGHVLAQYNLGNAYLHGRGLDKDLDQAEAWWRKASLAGYVRAQYNLGILLLEQAATATAREEGLAWLRASAERGFPLAADKLEDLGESVQWRHDPDDPTGSLLRSEARLLTLPPQTYTIQMFSGRLANSAERFIDGNGLRERALRFRFPHQDETWTGVLYGLYPNAEDAHQTVEEMRPSLKDAGPWIRPISDIQRMIREVWRGAETGGGGSP